MHIRPSRGLVASANAAKRRFGSKSRHMHRAHLASPRLSIVESGTRESGQGTQPSCLDPRRAARGRRQTWLSNRESADITRQVSEQPSAASSSAHSDRRRQLGLCETERGQKASDSAMVSRPSRSESFRWNTSGTYARSAGDWRRGACAWGKPFITISPLYVAKAATQIAVKMTANSNHGALARGRSDPG